MHSIPAVCTTCGSTFPGVSVGPNAGGVGTIEFSGCRVGPCPNCGGSGFIVDGIYQFVGDALRRIAAAGKTPEQIAQLHEVLREAQEQGAEPRSVPEHIKAEAPGMAFFAEWIRQYLVPKNAGEFWTMIGAILTALGIYMSMNPHVDEKEMNAIVDKAVNAAMSKNQTALPSITPAAHGAKKAHKVGRNDPCPCHKGKKYKHCCGKLVK